MVTWHRQIRIFFSNANNTHSNITFTYEASTALPFLDVLIKINNNSTIYTTAYCKPTDKHSYLHYKCNHPIHLDHCMIFSKFLRYEKICSDHRDFIKCSKELTHRFWIKGYPMTIVNKQWQKVVNIQRVNLLKCKEINSSGCLPIIHTYHPSVERVNKTIIKEFRNYSKLASSKHPFDVTPICAYRQPSNLRNILVRSNFPHTVTSTGNKNCGKPRCQICNIITTDTEINIPGTSHIYHSGNYKCDSTNIVYLLMCNNGNYVGETSTKYRLRMNNHKKNFRYNHKSLPVAVHYNQTDHSINDLSCVILSGNFTTTADRQLYEQKLIQRFDTYKCGLNRDLGFLSKYAFINRS